MRRKKIFLLSISALLLVNFACNASLPQAGPTAFPTAIQLPTVALTLESGQGSIPLSEAGVPRIAVDEAKAAFDSGEAIIVDVRSAQAFEASHVKGAINIQLGSFESDISNIPLEKDQWIITYCT